MYSLIPSFKIYLSEYRWSSLNKCQRELPNEENTFIISPVDHQININLLSFDRFSKQSFALIDSLETGKTLGYGDFDSYSNTKTKFSLHQFRSMLYKVN